MESEAGARPISQADRGQTLRVTADPLRGDAELGREFVRRHEARSAIGVLVHGGEDAGRDLLGEERDVVRVESRKAAHGWFPASWSPIFAPGPGT